MRFRNKLWIPPAFLVVGVGAFTPSASNRYSFHLPTHANLDSPLSCGTKNDSMRLMAAGQGPGNVSRPKNEFSRTYQTERILGGGRIRQRNYEVSIQAEQHELDSLGQRFDLSNIYMLEADLNLKREAMERGPRVSGVEVTGTIRARVTQTCVRTNENFDVDLDFNVLAVVRPVASLQDDLGGMDVSEIEDAAEKGPGKRNRSKSVRNTSGYLNRMGMADLQRLVENFDADDDVMEDEAIYTMNGRLDLGELVSQLFWLKLDPYPKKPGTGPVFMTITG